MHKASRGAFEFFGTGQELRDWVYISDLVECLLQASEHASAAVPVFNAGTCHGVSVRDVLCELYRAAGMSGSPVFLGRQKEGDPVRLVADDSAEEFLGPLFQTPRCIGLRAYVTWYRLQGIHD
jgi:UDP-glucose 4-epimerase